MSIKETIKELIATKREGEYWDFKKEPHSNNSDLLHDIICMSNALIKQDKYIIVGVSDPAQGCIIEGLNSTTANRKTQAKIIDFIQHLDFAGSIRPEVEVHTITIDGKDVDVIRILDRPNKPYYLASDKDGVKANYIYTRVGDTNTPKNKSADIYHVEKLWRQRFSLDQSPLERYNTLLNQKESWVIDMGNKDYAYHQLFPEFRIEFSETREGWETYSHYYTNPKSFFGVAFLKYFTTTLYEVQYCYVDEMRLPLVVPKIGVINSQKGYISYFYFQMDTIEWRLNTILGLSFLYQRDPRYLPFIFYKDEEEKDAFHSHVKNIAEELLTREPESFEIDKQKRIEEDGKGCGITPQNIGRLVREHISWKSSR